MRNFLKTIAILIPMGAAGCASTPESTYYLFPTPAVQERLPYEGGTIAVREISLPLYARQATIATIAEDGSVNLSEGHRWADEPPRAATGALVAALKQILGTTIVSEPWPSSVSPDYRIDVTVEHLIGDARGGDLKFSGQYRIFSANNQVDEQDSFAYQIPISKPGYAGLTQAHSDAIAKLALEIATAIQTEPTT